jgi:hypothetical protein
MSMFEPGQPIGKFVYPRLPWAAAERLIEEHHGLSKERLEAASSTRHSAAEPAKVGTEIAPERLAVIRDHLRDDLRNVAKPFGWPIPRDRVAEFDRILGASLYRELDIVPSDAASEGVWSFLTLVLLPEVGPWRFPNASGNKRYRGVPRNVLRRTWWRAHVLGPELGGSTDGSSYFGEDELVQIFERANLAANPSVAKAIVRSVHRNSTQLPGARSNFVRDLTRRLLRLMPLISFDALTQEDFDELLDRLTAASMRAIETSE